jgi:hypothetical protein
MTWESDMSNNDEITYDKQHPLAIKLNEYIKTLDIDTNRGHFEFRNKADNVDGALVFTASDTETYIDLMTKIGVNHQNSKTVAYTEFGGLHDVIDGKLVKTSDRNMYELSPETVRIIESQADKASQSQSPVRDQLEKAFIELEKARYATTTEIIKHTQPKEDAIQAGMKVQEMSLSEYMTPVYKVAKTLSAEQLIGAITETTAEIKAAQDNIRYAEESVKKHGNDLEPLLNLPYISGVLQQGMELKSLGIKLDAPEVLDTESQINKSTLVVPIAVSGDGQQKPNQKPKSVMTP